ncbi:MAG: alpha-glucosidase [Firmicutes bacterium]|jgi:alpha-glucosidase|nr:alpha-glucosidase [Bacillota bacterium]
MKEPWWKEAVIYQIYPRSFLDSGDDGVGDIRGIISKLDYLNDGTERSLGIDAIWLNPVYPSPQYDFGYDIMDFRGIDPQYGTMADFEELLREAHKRNIRIIMDIVPSVTSHLHPWFIESRSSRDNPRRDWYIWQDAPPNRKYPNNWLGAFGGRAWDWDKKTGQFYYHNSLPEQPDLNWRNPEVEREILDVLDFWFQKGVDGFRIDVLNYPYKDKYFRSNPYCIGIRPYDMQKHLYDKDLPESVEVGKKMRLVADRYPDRMLVAEVYNFDPEEAVRYYGEDRDGPHMVFNFSAAFSPFRASAFQKKVERWEELVADRGWPCYFFSNHDIPRHITRFSLGQGRWATERARVAAAFLLTIRGTPFLYMGEEIGMKSYFMKKKDLMDPVGIRYWPFYGRDWARTPVQWNDGLHAGFSGAKPWLPVNPDYRECNVQAQENDPGSLLNWYRKLIWLRKKHSALGGGKLIFLRGLPEGLLGYLRRDEKEEILVLLNFTAAPGKCALLHGSKRVEELLSYEARLDGEKLYLGRYGIFIAGLKSV